jgi:hypothetical protein
LLLTLSFATQAVEFAGGTGDPNNPYQIATAEQLIAIGSDPNLLDKCFILINDINLDPNLSGGRVFDKPVIAPQLPSMGGSSITRTVFSGVFTGNEYTISNLTIQGRSYLGLFGEISGSVKNVRLVDVDISGSASSIGSLVGCNDEGTVIQCWSSGLVERERNVGGLVGYNQGDIAGSCSSNTVTGTETYVGGLVGGNAGSITASCSTGVVTGNDFVGGLVGWNDRVVTASYSTAGVAGMNNVGGLVGCNYGGITACYSKGSVTGTGHIGGFVGNNNRGIAFCYSTGSVTGTEYVGGFGGGDSSDGGITSSFWDIETSGTSESEGGTGRTTAEMQKAQPFLDAGWDFENVWMICERVDYPRLRWEGVVCDEED